jgi:copper(I)-binding protein
MMMSLKQQLKPGDTVPLTLEFRRADGRSWTLDLQAIASLAAPTR